MTDARGMALGLKGATVVATLAMGAVGCSGGLSAGMGGASGQQDSKQNAPSWFRIIGDGSTVDTGAQPHQPEVRRLTTGQTPPQFVVFSWDGAGEDAKKLFSHFRRLAKRYDASMTYFLTGIYLLPETEADRYEPPGHPRGASDIGYLKDENIRATLKQLRLAWQDGSEIGTHFNGHFCGATGVGSWTTEQWKSEIRQARWFVENWKTTTGWKDATPLPFDYGEELIGARTPCLEGRENFLPAARELGFRYDSSGTGLQVWPERDQGLWDLPLQSIPFPGREFETLSMDYNFLANQSGTVDGDPAMRQQWGTEMRDGLLQAFERAYHGNRAPLIIGNHFESWNGGVYMKAVEDVVKTVCPKDEVRCVSFRQLVDWLDAQDPAVLDKLRTLTVGERPAGGWSSFLTADPSASGDPRPAS